VEVVTLRGPLFFGAASRLNDAAEAVIPAPKAFVLRLRDVPMIDASGVGALDRFFARCADQGSQVIVSELGAKPRSVLAQMGVLPPGRVIETLSYDEALKKAAEIAAA
jgi:SulP family sulfate permease